MRLPAATLSAARGPGIAEPARQSRALARPLRTPSPTVPRSDRIALAELIFEHSRHRSRPDAVARLPVPCAV